VTANQALLNMHFAVANGKGVQLDASQTAAVLALIEAQSEERAAVVAYLRAGTAECRYCLDASVIDLAARIERGVHRKETT